MKEDLYFFSSGELSRKNDTLCFQSEKGKKYIPVTNTDAIHIFGDVSVNKSLLEFAAKHEIILHFYNYYDYYVGSFYPREHLNSGFVTLKQSEAYNNPEKRLLLARLFIQGASDNILQVLKYYQRRSCEFSSEIDQISTLRHSLDRQDCVERIMAIEGNIRQVYYQCFNQILDNSDFHFTVRSKRPPKDKINSLISFGNTLLYNLVLSQLYQTQLDPRIGFLHSTNDRRFLLNLDIAEIFKPIVVDRTIFTLINKKIITKKDFGKELDGILLKENSRSKFVSELNDKLQTTIKHPSLDNRVTYKRLIRLEAYKIQKFLTEGTEYRPFLAKW